MGSKKQGKNRDEREMGGGRCTELTVDTREKSHEEKKNKECSDERGRGLQLMENLKRLGSICTEPEATLPTLVPH